MRLLLVLLVLAPACTEITGSGEYRVGDGPEVDNPCGQDEVLTDDRTCAKVGVPADQCAEGFEPAASGPGCTAVLPDQDCTGGDFAYPGLRECTRRPDYCNAALYPSVGLSPDRLIYVDVSSTGCTPDGTEGCPYPSIGQAVDQARADENRRKILVRYGEYREDLVVDVSGLSIEACGARVTLQGVNARPTGPYPCGRLQALKETMFPYERQAALCIPPGTEDVTIQNLIVTGPGDGIQVVGARGVRIAESRISDTGMYGLRIQEAGLGAQASPDGQVVSSEVTLEDVVVSGAHGVGVYASGSDLTIERSSIELTRPLSPAPENVGLRPPMAMGWARGLALRSSGWPLDGLGADPESFGPSHVTISDSAITGHPEVGLSVEGSIVKVERSFIGALPQGEASGPGIFVGRALPSGALAELTVSQSVIERASDAAIDVLDANLEVVNTTIRDTRGRTGDGCSGQGIRVRSLPPGDARSTVTVDHSVIVDSRQAAVLAASATVTLTDTLVRGIAPEESEGACIEAMGDGVSLIDLPDQPPAQASLERVRIDDARRAALVKTEGASLSLASTVLACSQHSLVESKVGNEAAPASGAICGCDGDFARCESVAEPLPSWIVAGPSPAWPGNIYERTVCLYDLGSSDIPIVGAPVWRLDEPEVAPAVTLADACCQITGPVTAESSPVVMWKPGYLAWAPLRAADALVPSGVSTVNLQLSTSVLTGAGIPVDMPFGTIQAPNGYTLSLEPPGPVYLYPSFSEPLTVVPGPPGGVQRLLVAPRSEPGWVRVSLGGPTLDCSEGLYPFGSQDNPNEGWVFLGSGAFSTVGFIGCTAPPP